jgi:hypothetical protein
MLFLAAMLAGAAGKMRGSVSLPPPLVSAQPVETMLPTLLAMAACWIVPMLCYYLFAGSSSADAAPAPEVVGLGYCSEAITGVSADAVWASMIAKIKQPHKFLPVGDVTTTDKRSADGKPFIWRTMRFVGAGPMNGAVIVEHIYAERETGEIRFVILDAAGKPLLYSFILPPALPRTIPPISSLLAERETCEIPFVILGAAGKPAHPFILPAYLPLCSVPRSFLAHSLPSPPIPFLLAERETGEIRFVILDAAG